MYIPEPCQHEVCKRCYEDWTDKASCKICHLRITSIIPTHLIPSDAETKLYIPGGWLAHVENVRPLGVETLTPTEL